MNTSKTSDHSEKNNFHLRSEAGLNPKLKVWFPQPQWLHFPFLSPFLPSPPHRLSSPRAPSPPSAWWRRPWHTEVSPARGQTHRPAGRHRYPPPLLLLLLFHSFRRKKYWDPHISLNLFLFSHFFVIFLLFFFFVQGLLEIFQSLSPLYVSIWYDITLYHSIQNKKNRNPKERLDSTFAQHWDVRRCARIYLVVLIRAAGWREEF